jgi:hypothetical protein
VLRSKTKALGLSETSARQDRPPATREVSHIQQPTMSTEMRFFDAIGTQVADNIVGSVRAEGA